MDYIYKKSAIFPLLSLIRLKGDNINVAEIGIEKGFSTFHALQECPNIKNYYAIDPYCEYLDNITYDKHNFKQIKFDLRYQDRIKSFFIHQLKFSSFKNKIKFIEKTSKEALSLFEDNSLDFIFHDAFPTYEDAVFDFKNWYCKLKHLGFYCGHDYKHPIVKKAVDEFVINNTSYKKPFSVEDCWFIVKD